MICVFVSAREIRRRTSAWRKKTRTTLFSWCYIIYDASRIYVRYVRRVNTGKSIDQRGSGLEVSQKKNSERLNEMVFSKFGSALFFRDLSKYKSSAPALCLNNIKNIVNFRYCFRVVSTYLRFNLDVNAAQVCFQHWPTMAVVVKIKKYPGKVSTPLLCLKKVQLLSWRTYAWLVRITGMKKINKKVWPYKRACVSVYKKKIYIYVYKT